MMGSKRLGTVEQEIGAIRQALDRQALELAAAGNADDQLRGRLEEIGAALGHATAELTALTARIDAVEAALAHQAVTRDALDGLQDAIEAERSQRAALEQTIAKLTQRVDAQADEARVTATALLQRMAAPTRAG